MAGESNNFIQGESHAQNSAKGSAGAGAETHMQRKGTDRRGTFRKLKKNKKEKLTLNGVRYLKSLEQRDDDLSEGIKPCRRRIRSYLQRKGSLNGVCPTKPAEKKVTTIET